MSSHLDKHELRIAVALAMGAQWVDVPPAEIPEGFTQEEADFSRSLHPRRLLAFRPPAFSPPPRNPKGPPSPTWSFPDLGYADLRGEALWRDIPDYPNDLEACAEMRKHLRRHGSVSAPDGIYSSEQEQFVCYLMDELVGGHMGSWPALGPSATGIFHLIDSSPEAQCRAFIRVKQTKRTDG